MKTWRIYQTGLMQTRSQWMLAKNRINDVQIYTMNVNVRFWPQTKTK